MLTKKHIFIVLIFIVCEKLNAQTQPPVEKGDFYPTDLVELTGLDSTIVLDIRYATSNNFVGRPVYQQARAFLQKPAAEALVKVNTALKPLGYGLVIFDGYRPWRVTKTFWEITPPDKKQFVANPSNGSRHNRGCAVDVSLINLATGQQVSMPSAYDEMTERAYPDYKGGTQVQRAARDLLRKTMETHGFTVYKYEWWHFDYQSWQHYHLLDIPFEEIK